jgi:hypothetical protein
MTVTTSDDVGREEVLAICSANGWSAANKPSQLISALRNSHSLVTVRDGKTVPMWIYAGDEH